jgi:rod shape-determining protein MreC
VITGRGQDTPRLELVDPTVEVSHGEEVVTSGYDKGIYPPGIPIGRVDKAQEARDGLTQSATIEPFVAFSRLDFVRVLLDSGPLRGLDDAGQAGRARTPQQPAQVGPTPSPTPSPKASGTPRPTPTPKSSPTLKATPTGGTQTPKEPASRRSTGG